MITSTAVARTPLGRFVRRFTIVVALVLVTMGLAPPGPASAYAPVDVVHTEHVQAGPYTVTVGFSAWPVRALQSQDFTFAPDGGITDKSGRLTVDGPGVKHDLHDTPLVRHPRKPSVWGLDVEALNAPGTYRFGFTIDGPQGRGHGTLDAVTVLDQPGPPLLLSWGIASLPFVLFVVLLAVAWRRTRASGPPVID
ncbi:MAG: hypothetical protein JWR37_4279 [Mycobacterium sp.]|jgi:hypothetical protein|nr:hypothetical protein [Mycobacterium sp.]